MLLLAGGFILPILSTPAFPAIPLWILPGGPVILALITALFAGLATRFYLSTAWLLAATVVWITLGTYYHERWWALVGD